MLDKDLIIAHAARQAIFLCMTWLPDGELKNRKQWVARNPTRDDKNPGSFTICVAGNRSGSWADFSTGDKGKNMITLYCYLNGLNPSEKDHYKKAIREVTKTMGLGK